MLSIPDPDHDFYVDFIVTNVGTETLKLPIFVDMAKLEPNDPQSAYRYRHLALIVISGTQHDDTVLQGGANLYGNEQLAGSLLSLDPQQSIRVHAKAKLRAMDGSDQVKVQSIVGRVLLSTDTVRLSSGKLAEDEAEIGFADSQPVSLVRNTSN